MQYTVSIDGHVIGVDGFVVPASWEEFFGRYPDHVKSFVHRHMTGSSEPQQTAVEAALSVHLTNAATFDPALPTSVSSARFFGYVTTLLLAKLDTMLIGGQYDRAIA